MIFGTLSFPILCVQCEKSGAAAYTDGTVSSPYTSVTMAAAAAAAGVVAALLRQLAVNASLTGRCQSTCWRRGVLVSGVRHERS